MFRLFLFPLLIAFSTGSFAQTDTTYVPPRPPIGLDTLARLYYAAEWSPLQHDSLGGALLQLTYLVDDIGEPFLKSAYGLISPTIFARLSEITRGVPYFEPATRGGFSVAGEYVFWFRFPQHGEGEIPPEVLFPFVPRRLSLDSLQENFVRNQTDLYGDVNLFYVSHLGTVGTYLKGGGGIDCALGARVKPHLGLGLVFGVEINGRHRPFPDDPLPDRDDVGSGIYIGGLMDYVIVERPQKEFSVRSELAFGALNAANRLEPNEEEGWVQYRGLHTGLAVQYTLRIGGYRPNLIFGSPDAPTARYSAINLLGGVRYRYYGDKEGTGAYFFLGAGYRFGRDSFRRRP